MREQGPFRFVAPGSSQFTNVFRQVNRQPNWAIKVAALVFLLIVGIPILALLVIATITATVVFAVIALGNALLNKCRSIGKGDAGRKNVRVINRN